MDKHLIILRGLPGCGKSTFAEYISTFVDNGNVNTSVICTADDYFMKDGEYKFNPYKLIDAHLYSQNKCEEAMKKGVKRIIVANTSVSSKEFEPYVEMAKKYGYKVFSIVVENRHGNKNIHNVPDNVLDSMEKRFDLKLK